MTRSAAEQDLTLLAYQESLALTRQLVQEQTDQPERCRDLSVTLNKSGDVYRMREDLDPALRACRESADTRRQLVLDQPDQRGRRYDRCLSLGRVALLLEQQEQREMAAVSTSPSWRSSKIICAAAG